MMNCGARMFGKYVLFHICCDDMRLETMGVATKVHVYHVSLVS